MNNARAALAKEAKEARMRRAQATADLKRIAVELWRNDLRDIEQIAAITELDHEVVAREIEVDSHRSAGRPRVEVDLLELILLYESGMTLDDVAAQVGVGAHIVASRMEEAGVPRRPAGGSRRQRVTLSEADLRSIKTRNLAGEKLKDLADEYGMSPSGLSNRLKNAGYSAMKVRAATALTDAQAKDASERQATGETYAELAARFGTSEHQVKKAVWQHRSSLGDSD
ncbi:hypothetical protein ACFV2X_38040 [Streptomyces sp. NPDC059679]|uniref:hypothetical protein n=1 Tax=Streptomyces sp. NPDC059679 TaxID=3346903 RepID=UPI0036B479FE